jgi:hypothetical protein
MTTSESLSSRKGDKQYPIVACPEEGCEFYNVATFGSIDEACCHLIKAHGKDVQDVYKLQFANLLRKKERSAQPLDEKRKTGSVDITSPEMSRAITCQGCTDSLLANLQTVMWVPGRPAGEIPIFLNSLTWDKQ